MFIFQGIKEEFFFFCGLWCWVSLAGWLVGVLFVWAFLCF